MNVHTPSPPKILITTIGGSKTYLICHSFSLIIILTQKSKYFNPYQILSHMQQLTHTPTENPSTNIYGNQQNIHDVNIQRQEVDKGMLIANALKGKLNNQNTTNASWLVTTIKAILTIPIQKIEKLIFSFRITHEALVRNKTILAVFKGDLGKTIAAQKDFPVNSRSEFRDIVSIEKLFLYYENKTKIINIIQQGSRYHLDPIPTRTKIESNVRGTQGGPGTTPLPPPPSTPSGWTETAGRRSWRCAKGPR